MGTVNTNEDAIDVNKNTTIYVYRLSDGLFLYTHTGPIGYAMEDLGSDKDFTMRKLPDETQIWYWLDSDWIQKEKTQEEPMQ